MRRLNLWLATAMAVLVAAAVVACARDTSAPADATMPLTAALAEGASVRASLRETVEVPGVAGASDVRELGLAASEAVVAGGVAVEHGTGAVLALAPGRGAGHRVWEYADDEGHRHRITTDGPPGQGPLASVRYERDGQVVAEIAYRWESRAGGAVLRDRVLTLRRNGMVLLRHVRAARAVDVAPGTAAADAATLGARGPLPPSLAQALPCLREWVMYVGASAALIVAGEVFTLAPNPATTAALLSAVGAWETALNALLDCQLASVLP